MEYVETKFGHARQSDEANNHWGKARVIAHCKRQREVTPRDDKKHTKRDKGSDPRAPLTSFERSEGQGSEPEGERTIN